ncbi:Asp23/Gls24 family envelope stress response protein [Paenibacillus xerothermodurans]|uniref:Asp23/Gls24 family envelope stress response protein n=1 Tax=Paenibacillus xerothermodurans TaxID=1977292 RepID=A0A2W1NEY4_PAEXE|nr:Asp23/Gls24 family envelope stress response protein [Paenibacillus xerothermodurans]PZE22514.1 Asp23/Gls24 family envelope stress response protein [Paenibacillus xerothermodurans]
MAIELATEYGKIFVTDEVIALLAGSAALDCYGLVGMASRNQLKDGIAELLRRDNLRRGVEIHRDAQGALVIDLYIVVSYGTKISVVAHNVQTKVKYVLNEVVGLQVEAVNIYVQGVRVAE